MLPIAVISSKDAFNRMTLDMDDESKGKFHLVNTPDAARGLHFSDVIYLSHAGALPYRQEINYIVNRNIR